MPARAETATSDWRDRSACLNEDPELFFPIGNTGPAVQQLEEAKAVCARCPVLEQCRTWAMDNPKLTEYGVFGGMSEEERRALRRKRRRRSDASHVAA
jgi:WhiB family transcriptional regulator, redox-sensing transcriptional regulator